MKQYLFKYFLFALLIISFAGCEERDFYNSKEGDLLEIANLRSEIDKLSEQVTCENSADWLYS